MKIENATDKAGILGSILLVQFCPLCIPAIGAFLASIGLGFLLTATVLRGLLVVMLVMAVGGIAFSTFRGHKNAGPLLIAVPGSICIYLARWFFFNNLWFYVGAILLISASVWNLLLRKKKCTQCEGKIEKANTVILKSTLRCPVCGFEQEETMPTDNCLFFYECGRCGKNLKPKPGDCCVFCSYGTLPCPPKQEEESVQR